MFNAEVQIVTIITEAEGVVDRAVAMAVYTTEVTTDGEPIRRDLWGPGVFSWFLAIESFTFWIPWWLSYDYEHRFDGTQKERFFSRKRFASSRTKTAYHLNKGPTFSKSTINKHKRKPIDLYFEEDDNQLSLTLKRFNGYTLIWISAIHYIIYCLCFISVYS